jgi:hypothetical protein
MDTIFRKKTDIQEIEEKLPEGKQPDRTPVDDKVEVPYSEYEHTKGHPFIVDYFNLGGTWEDPQGGFLEEVTNIQDYINSLINSGEINNSLSAVKNRLKAMEKENNLKEEERIIVKIGILSAYARFLNDKDTLKGKVRKYGTR